MPKTTQERPFEQQACMAFVGLSITIGVIGFWAKGMLPGALLTVAMGVIVYLLSRAVERVQEAWTTKNFFTGCIAAFLAAGFVAIEASLNHIGLEHLNTTYDLAPAEYLWPACWFVSLVNVFASYGFARTLEDRRKLPQPTATASTTPLDDAFFGQPGTYRGHADRMADWERKAARDPEVTNLDDARRRQQINTAADHVRSAMGL